MEKNQNEPHITVETLWDVIVAQEGNEFHTSKGLEFTYTIKGNELFTNRRERSITKSTFEVAYEKIRKDTQHKIKGPKALGVFGAPYVWAILKGIGCHEVSNIP